MLTCISKLVTLLKVLAVHPLNGVLTKTKQLSLTKLKRYRICNHYIFTIVCWWGSISPREAAGRVKQFSYLSKTSSKTAVHSTGVDLYLKDICNTIADWNIFTNIDDSVDIHEASVVTTYDASSGRYPDLNSALLHTSRLAYGVRNMCVSTVDEFYVCHYAKLLDGVDRSLLRDSDNHTILCHPVINRLASERVPGICSIAALMLLISGFGKVDQALVRHLEESVTDRFITIMEHNDLVITGGKHSLHGCDLRPNALYNTTKCFIHTGIKILQRNLTPDDLKIFISFIQMRPSTDLPFDECDTEGVIDAATALEAVFNLYLDTPAINKSPIMNLQEFIDKALGWLRYYKTELAPNSPELESIIFKLAIKCQDTSRMNIKVDKILRSINPLYDRRLLVITDTPEFTAITQDTFIGVDTGDSRLDVHNTARYCRTTDSYIHGNKLTHPVFEYLMVYSRVHSFVANRLTKGVRSE